MKKPKFLDWNVKNEKMSSKKIVESEQGDEYCKNSTKKRKKNDNI